MLQKLQRSEWLWYLLVVTAVLAVSVAGFSGYLLYPRFGLPSVSGAGLLALAVAAGIAAFFSPCSFPLLVSLLGRESKGQSDHANSDRVWLYGTALAVGATGFFALFGLLTALVGSSLFEDVTFTSTTGITIRFVVGSVLILLGIIQLDLLPISFRAADRLALPLLRGQAHVRRSRPLRGYVLLGFFYPLAGFG